MNGFTNNVSVRSLLPFVTNKATGSSLTNFVTHTGVPSHHQNIGRINNLRGGESILLGCETLGRKAIPGLHRNAFQLVAEVIESKRKASVPLGEICQDAFGNVPGFLDRGDHQRVIIALGRQDVQASNLKSNNQLRIIGSSSDHIILDGDDHNLKVGDEVRFSLDYSGLLATMTSPFVMKQFADSDADVVV